MCSSVNSQFRLFTCSLDTGEPMPQAQPPWCINALYQPTRVHPYPHTPMPASRPHLMARWARWYSTNGASPGITATTCTQAAIQASGAAILGHTPCTGDACCSLHGLRITAQDCEQHTRPSRAAPPAGTPLEPHLQPRALLLRQAPPRQRDASWHRDDADNEALELVRVSHQPVQGKGARDM